MIGLFLNLIDTQGEKEKFTLLYEKYKNLLYYVAVGKTKNNEAAEDCVAETFLYVAKHFEKIGDVESKRTKGYLVTIVTGFAIDIYNKTNRYELVDIDDTEAQRLSYFDNIENVELSCAIDSLLNEEEKIFIYLNFVYGYKSAEIAEIYNVTDISVRKKIERAIKKLKNYFEEEAHEQF